MTSNGLVSETLAESSNVDISSGDRVRTNDGVENEGLDREKGSVAMEFDLTGDITSREGSGDGKATNSSDSKWGSLIVVGNDIQERHSIDIEDQKPLSDDGFGKKVKKQGNDDETIDGNVVAVVSNSDGSEKETNDVVKGTETKGVNLVVDLGSCVRKDKEKRKKNDGFCVSDLVWGKVRSHPWWPGQIFETGDASDMGRKHFRSKSYLVAYFGDHTFAWNDEVKLKPFVPHFSQMVKQTSMEAFRLAVGCALDEVSRRVEFGLSCHCIAEDVYNRLKTQVVENVGIREQSRLREGGDRFLTASSFEPVQFLDYVKNLALEPNGEFDRLEHVMALSQMSSFCRWKGWYHLAEFGPLMGYVNNDIDTRNSMAEHKEEICKLSDDETVPLRSMKKHVSRPQKRKKMSGHSYCSVKRVKRLSELTAKKGSYQEEDDEESKGKAGSKSISSSVWRQKAIKVPHNDSQNKGCSPQTPGKSGVESRNSKPSFRVGESILRVAGQLSQPSPLLKLDVSSHKKPGKAKGGDSKESQRQKKVVPAEYSSDEILSELHVAAKEPLKDHRLLNSMTGFLSEHRNQVVKDSDLSQKHEELAGEDAVAMSEEKPADIAEGCSSSSKSKEKASGSEITTMSDGEAVEDADCTENVVNDLEKQTLSSDKNEAVVGLVEPSNADGVSGIPPETEGAVSSFEPHNESEEFDKKMKQEDTPTALTLKFTDMDSIPSEEKLNKIFSHFGPLKESETEVLTKKNCARVVFKRRVDAETAFSSSGKFETFGPALVCYRLNYAPSPRKSPSVEAKRKRKDGSPVER